MLIRRRSFLFSLIAGLAAPAIVRATSLMPVRGLIPPEPTIVRPRPGIMGVPRCHHCFGAWGMCSHTGGPMDLADMRLDPRLEDILRLDLA